MSELPSPVLIYGDYFISKSNIDAIKRKYDNDYEIVTISLSTSSLDTISSNIASIGLIPLPKIIIIRDIPNQKIFREHVIDLFISKIDARIIIWDSQNTIKIDQKTKLANKTWEEFISKFKTINGSKVINNGGDLTDKDDGDCISYTQNVFQKYKKKIGNNEARIFVSIVGRDRGLLMTEIEKMSISCPETLSMDYIIENAFPTSKEAILYKFSNALDGSYSQAVLALDQFLYSGTNENVLAEIIAKKARWQLIACHMYSKGMSWYDVDRNLMSMGKFPSYAWHSNKLSYDQKQKISDLCETEEGLEKYITRDLGLPLDYFHYSEGKKIKKTKKEDNEEVVKETKKILGKKEALPMPFLATQITSALQSNFVVPNMSNMKTEEIRVKMLDRAINTYLGCVDRLKEIRYGENPRQDIYEMVRIMTERAL